MKKIYIYSFLILALITGVRPLWAQEFSDPEADYTFYYHLDSGGGSSPVLPSSVRVFDLFPQGPSGPSFSEQLSKHLTEIDQRLVRYQDQILAEINRVKTQQETFRVYVVTAPRGSGLNEPLEPLPGLSKLVEQLKDNQSQATESSASGTEEVQSAPPSTEPDVYVEITQSYEAREPVSYTDRVNEQLSRELSPDGTVRQGPLREFTNDQGVIKTFPSSAPWVEQLRLKSHGQSVYVDPDTPVEIRQHLNQLLAMHDYISQNPGSLSEPFEQEVNLGIFGTLLWDNLASFDELHAQPGAHPVENFVQTLKNVVHINWEFFKGMGLQVKDDAQGLYQAISNPVAVGKALGIALLQWPKTLELITKYVEKSWAEYKAADPDTKAQIHGRISAEILLSVTGVGPILKALNVLQKAEVITQATAKAIRMAGVYTKRSEWLAPNPALRSGVHLIPRDGGIEVIRTFFVDGKRLPNREILAALSADQVGLRGSSYLLKQLKYAEANGLTYSADDLLRMATRHKGLDAGFSHVTPTTFEGTSWRAVLERNLWDPQGGVNIPAGKSEMDEIFRWHEGMRTANGRFTVGGPFGDEALYGAIGPENVARMTVIEELGKFGNQPLRLASQEVRLQKVLDLTDPDTLRHLGIDSSVLKMEKKLPGAYDWTQAIGDLAKQHGFDGIITPSAVPGGGNNLIILRSP